MGIGLGGGEEVTIGVDGRGAITRELECHGAVETDFVAIGGELERALEQRQRLGRPTLRHQHRAQPVERLGVVGRQRDRAPVGGGRGLGLGEIAQRVAQVVEDDGIVGVDRERPFELLSRLADVRALACEWRMPSALWASGRAASDFSTTANTVVASSMLPLAWSASASS